MNCCRAVAWCRSVSLACLIGLLGGGIDGAAPIAFAEETSVRAEHRESPSVVEARLKESVELLASDAFEGRGVGSKGLNMAADYLAVQFARAGLDMTRLAGGPFQHFTMTVNAKLGGANQLSFLTSGGPGGGAETIPLKLGEDFTPLSLGGSATLDLPLVFVGYGITAKHEDYDDYAGVDVKGKAVIILRHEPQQANPHSVFNGAADSQYATFSRKVSNAYEHGAKAVIFCTDRFDLDKSIAQWEARWQSSVDQLAEVNAKFKAIAKPTAEERKTHRDEVEKLAAEIATLSNQVREAADPLLKFDSAATDSGRSDLAVIACRRSAINSILRATLDKTLDALEVEIDTGPTPKSAALSCRVLGEVTVERQETDVKNVIGVLEGSGPLAEETIVIGAHYDHLGLGGPNSLAPGLREIHNGADDNASGSAVLVEVARILAARPQKLARRVVFIAFTGEERGLTGSAYYMRHPLFPLDKTVAMLNMDMVGRLTDEKLIVYGTGTAKEFSDLVDRFGKEQGFEITKHPAGFGPSDHASFYAQQIPVLHYFTGAHGDYHRPGDDVDKINVPGMRRVGELVSQMAIELANTPARPQYTEAPSSPVLGRGGDRPYFGSIPDFSQDKPGYALTGVSKDGPAARAGIRGGDIIIRLGESQIGNLEDFDSALRKYKAGDKVPVKVKRGDAEVEVTVTLDPPR